MGVNVGVCGCASACMGVCACVGVCVCASMSPSVLYILSGQILLRNYVYTGVHASKQAIACVHSCVQTELCTTISMQSWPNCTSRKFGRAEMSRFWTKNTTFNSFVGREALTKIL